MSSPKVPSDPAIRPMDDSDSWYESGPEPIWDDQQAAILMVRIGMAQNALVAEMEMASLVISGIHTNVRRVRSSLSRLVMTAALVSEATKLAQQNMRELRRLALSAHKQPRAGLLEEIGQLCAGKHSASQVIERARNKVGFHWDADEIGDSVVEFGKNAQIVWLEAAGEHFLVHRLSSDVLARVLFPETDTPNLEANQRVGRRAMEQFSEAINLIVEFFTAATYGYLKIAGARRRER